MGHHLCPRMLTSRPQQMATTTYEKHRPALPTPGFATAPEFSQTQSESIPAPWGDGERLAQNSCEADPMPPSCSILSSASRNHLVRKRLWEGCTRHRGDRWVQIVEPGSPAFKSQPQLLQGALDLSLSIHCVTCERGTVNLTCSSVIMIST